MRLDYMRRRGVIFNHQNLWGFTRTRRQFQRTALVGHKRGDQRQGKIERASVAGLAIQSEITALELHKALRDGQAKAGALGGLAGLLQALERFEDALLFLDWNARAVVGYIEADKLVDSMGRYFYSSSVRGELHGVAQKVH